MKKRTLSLLLAIIMIMGSASIPMAFAAEEETLEFVSETEYASSTDEDLTEYVNMRYGTGTNAECLIGPSRPNGSVHPGPDTFKINNYTGYYPNQPIRGFSQLHIQSGEGRFGQFLISPQVGLSVALDSHDSEKANENPTATEYSVTLSKYDIDVALTPTENAVIYKLTYPQGTDDASIVLDMIHHVPVYNEANGGVYNKQAKDVDITIEQDEDGNTVLYGGAKYGAHGGSDRYYYFYAVIDSASLANKNIGVYEKGAIVEGATAIDTPTNTIADPEYKGTGAYLTFDLDSSAETTVMMKIGVSFLSTDKAKASLEAEIPAWNYDKVKSDNNAIWNDKLDVIEVSGLTEAQKEMFYTNLYDTFLQPRYRTGELAEYGDGMMLDDHVATWDTFRTLFPLLTITNPQLVTDQVESYLVRFADKEAGSADTVKAVKDIFTGFERVGTNQGGDNIDNVVAEAYVKGLIPDEMMDAVMELVEFEANMMRVDRNGAVQGTGSASSTYKDLGFIPADKYPMMNCNTQLEYCYNDFCLAQIAKGEGNMELYEMLMARSASWLNIWNEDAEGDKFTGFIWPKNSDGTFVEPSDSYKSATQFVGSWKPYFYEGTGYSYSFFVPHDIPALMEKMGGEEEFIERLQVGIDKGYIDVSNQPGYIQAFLFNYTNEPWHTTDYVQKLINRYTINSTPGCEDSGASCAWYVFANIGFFPSAGQDIYWLTSPKYEQTKINLDNGNTFTIKANNLSSENKYIQSVSLNGEVLYDTMIRHSDIVNGGELVFNMGESPVDYSSTEIASGKTAAGEYDWSLRTNGILNISGDGDGTLNFDSAITADNFSAIPWNEYKDIITSVNISEASGITAIADYVLADLPACTKIFIPTTLTNLGAKGIFAGDALLETIAVQGKSVTACEYNLYNVLSAGDDIFEGCADSKEITLTLGKCENFAPVKWFSDSTNVIFDLEGNTSAAEWTANVQSGTSDTRAEGYKFTIKEVYLTAKGEETVGNLYSWVLDTETGVLTFTNPKTSWNELSFNTTDQTAFAEWVVDWKGEIEHIVIPAFSKMAIRGTSPFAGLTNLKTVKCDTVRWLNPSTIVFDGCSSLTTFGTSSTFEKGKVKLSGISIENLGSGAAGLFRGCSSMTDVDFTGLITRSDDSAVKPVELGGNMLKNCSALKTVNLTGVTAIHSYCFQGCNALEELTIPASMTSIKEYAISGSSLTSIKLETPEFTDGLAVAASFPDKDGLTIYCPNKAVKEDVEALGYTKTQVVYDQYATGSETVGNSYSWSLDKETGILTFTDDKPSSSWCELSFTKDATAFATWVAEYKDQIKHIVIPYFDKFSIARDVSSPFAGLTKLETVKIDTTRWLLNGRLVFEGCTSLTSLGKSANFEEGKIKLAGYQIENLSGGALPTMFRNCSSVTSVDFTGLAATSDGSGAVPQVKIIGASSFEGCTALEEVIFADVTAIKSNAFKNCTALKNITIPATLTTIEANAFAGCTALTSVTLKAESVSSGFMTATSLPDSDGLVVYCNNNDVKAAFDNLGYTKTKAVNVNALKVGGVAMEGFSIRTKEYNGLRGIFSFDNSAIELNEASGLTLVEYGTILATEANKNAYGTALTFDGNDHVTANEKVIKKAIYKNGSFVGSILETDENKTQYAVTIVRYSDNYQTNVCMLGYSIWQDAAGKIYYFYADSDNDAYDATSIYDVTLAMYKDGAVNAANDPDSVIWNTLVNGGAVTLTAGTDYKNDAIYFEADGTTAKSFGDSFLALDVPCANASVSGATTTCTNLGSTYSLFEDGDSYVIIFRAGTSGSNPKALPASTGNVWNTMYQPQYSSSFAPGATKIVNAPNPVFTSSVSAKITYAVIDDGITTISNNTFFNNSQIKTIVYPDTLSSIGQWAFKGSSVATMFKAGDTAEVGKLDFANYSGSMDTYAIFYLAKSFSKICLPSNLTELKGLAFNSSNVQRIWVAGGTDPKYDGIADLTGANISTGDSTFQHVKTLNLIMLHDSATLHSTRTLDQMTSDGVTVWTKNYSETIDKEVQSIKDKTNANYTSGYNKVSYIYGDTALNNYIATKYGTTVSE
ncbi:MAG: GH92 family glycosyl hydrolase [Clostridia bacterium]|nr:GH92 family glycosyl hydrolase [Clostridia bacterium]